MKLKNVTAVYGMDNVKLTSLLQLVDKLQQTRKIDKLQQACGVSVCVVLVILIKTL